MSADPAPIPLDDLLAHRAWVRALAVALTRDENEADDVEQDTWAAAIGNPPRVGTSERGWLRAVARNTAHRRHRTRERARRRQAQAVRPESVSADPSELAARAELHARVSAAVVALREPYRETVLLRYFEGLSVADVAARTGVPLETTRARLRRGREQLRARLERELGDRRPLAVALLPLLGGDVLRAGSGGTVATTVGGTIMSMKLMAATAALVIMGVGAWWVIGDGDDAPTPAVDVADIQVPEVAVERTETVTEAAPRERVRVAEPTPEPEPVDDAGAAPAAAPTVAELLDAPIGEVRFDALQLREALGRLSGISKVPVHVDRRATAQLENVPLTLQLNDVRARDALRTMTVFCGMQLVVEEDRVVLHARGEEWSPDLPTDVIEPVIPDPDAPTSLTVRGRVLDARGDPVADASIRHASNEVARSATDGTFEVELCKQFHWLTARRPGVQDSARFPVEGEYGETLETDLVLGAPAGAIRVTVGSDSGGVPPNATVRLHWNVTGDVVRLRDGREVPRSVSETLRVGESGVVVHESVGPGAVRVEVSGKEHVRELREVVAVAGETVEVEIELRKALLEDRLRDERISFVFEDAPLHEVVAYIRSTKAINVVLGPSARESFELPITLTVKDDTLESALRAVCAAAGDFTYEVRRGFVFVQKRER